MKHVCGKKLIAGVSLLTLGLSTMSIPAFAEDFQTALVSAYQRSNLLHAERARVREIDENYVQAQAQGRVSVVGTASAGFSRSETPVTIFGGGIQKLKPRTAQLSIIQPLYQGGRVKGLKSQAKAGILSARQGLRNAEQNVLFSAASAYLDVIRDEQAAKIRRNNVNVLTRQQFAAQSRFDVGEGTRTDIAQAEARLASADIGLSQAEAQLAVSRAAYVRYMGHAPHALSAPPKFVLPETLLTAQLRARANNPQIVASRYNENATKAGIRVAKSAHKPIISLNGGLQGSRDRRSESASIIAQIRVPIFSGGMNQSQVRAAKHAQIRSRFETREAEQAIDEAVANLWAQVIASGRALDSSRKQVAAAEIAFEGVELEQQVGTRTTLDVLNAEQELLNAKLTVIQAVRNLDLASYQLLVTMGGFDAYSLQLPVALYDPSKNFGEVTVGVLGGVSEKILGKLPTVSILKTKHLARILPKTQDVETINPVPELILLKQKK